MDMGTGMSLLPEWVRFVWVAAFGGILAMPAGL